jgi:hypothetical protein
VSASWHTVHVRINDAATGQPTPVRLRLTGPEGEYFPPFGRLAEFATGRNQDVGGNLLLGRKPYAYLDGTCEVRLPAGPVGVEIAKGPEYRPQRLEVALGPGKLALRLSVERWIDLRPLRWYPGDTRAHFLTPHAALLEAAAEDLAVVNLLATTCEAAGSHGRRVPAIPNLLAFSGQRPALEAPGHLVVVNTHNTHPVLGSLGLLNCHRIVYPLSFGGPSGRDDWTLAAWCDQCHRKGGLVVWTRPEHEAADFRYGEPLADLLLGKVDAFEIDFFEDSPFDVLPDWYALLNCGCRVPLVGASGKDSNGTALGSMRTYARLLPDREFNYTNWIEAVRAGRTFVTNGPLLSFTVAGRDPGASVEVPSAGQTVSVRAEARSILPFDRLEVVANGQVVASATGSPASAIVEGEIPVPVSGWLAARCLGNQQIFGRPANQHIFAHTSPVYVRRADKPLRVAADAVAGFVAELDRMLVWVATKARCDSDSQRQRLADIFQSARQELLSRPSRP